MNMNSLCRTFLGLLAAAILHVPAFATDAESEPADLYRRIKFHQGMAKATTTDPTKNGRTGWAAYLTEDDVKAIELQEKLQELADKGSGTAEFFLGVLSLEEGNAERSAELARQAFAKALDHFKRASQGGLPEATWNAAILFRQGQGTPVSKLAAAEWFDRAGQQYLKTGRREEALACLEQVEELALGKPIGKKLREQLYGASLRRGRDERSAPTSNDGTLR